MCIISREQALPITSMQWETDKEKPYRSLSQELKDIYGGKVYKLSLSSFCTCPNRDGSLGFGGCIFCSEGGSGEFAQASEADIDTQIEKAKELVAGKLKKKPAGYIAYFQSFSNTYGDIKRLRELYLRTIKREDVLILSLATRPDCLGEEVMELLRELNSIKPVWVELGLQTSDDRTAKFINRGYETKIFTEAFHKLKAAGIGVIAHVIIGLPFEEPEDTLRTISYLSGLLHEGRHIDGIKLHLMYVLSGTKLGRLYERGEAHLYEYSLSGYADMIADIIEHLPQDIVIHRITGDAPKRYLMAPLWSADKKRVLNTIAKRLRERGSYQGRCFTPPKDFT